MCEDLSEYGDVIDLFERYEGVQGNPNHQDYERFISELVEFVEKGHSDAALALGEELFSTRPEESYKWYYIGHYLSGYSVDWNDENHSPPHYGGPEGDFRNESMVSELVEKLSFETARKLDQVAARWLEEHNLWKRKG